MSTLVVVLRSNCQILSYCGFEIEVLLSSCDMPSLVVLRCVKYCGFEICEVLLSCSDMSSLFILKYVCFNKTKKAS